MMTELSAETMMPPRRQSHRVRRTLGVLSATAAALAGTQVAALDADAAPPFRRAVAIVVDGAETDNGVKTLAALSGYRTVAACVSGLGEKGAAVQATNEALQRASRYKIVLYAGINQMPLAGNAQVTPASAAESVVKMRERVGIALPQRIAQFTANNVCAPFAQMTPETKLAIQRAAPNTKIYEADLPLGYGLQSQADVAASCESFRILADHGDAVYIDGRSPFSPDLAKCIADEITENAMRIVSPWSEYRLPNAQFVAGPR